MTVKHGALKVLAYLGQLAALLPFAVLFDSMGMGGWTAWHFAAAFGVWAMFLAFGVLIGVLINSLKKSSKLPKKLEPLWNFLQKMGFVLPTAAFITLGVLFEPNPAVYVFILPAGIIVYVCAAITAGKTYSEIFTSFQFILYTIMSVFAMAALAMSNKSELRSVGGYILCAGFAVIALLTALIFNQKNVDVCTKQRGNGKAVLPVGLRGYNALLVTGIFTVTLGLFIFAKPLGALLKTVIATFVRAGILISDMMSSCSPDFGSETPPDIKKEPTDSGSLGDMLPPSDTGVSDEISTVIIVTTLVIFIIAFRKHILNVIKRLFAPLFKSRAKISDAPFSDEITLSNAKRLTPRSLKKAERELSRQYSRERSSSRKYRLGYALFLARLRRTKHSPELSDTVTVHREKGECEFDEELSGFSEVYSKVRYADVSPTERELSEQSEILKKIK